MHASWAKPGFGFSASVDNAEETQSLKDGIRIGFVEMLHSVDARAVADATGALLQERDRPFLHATAFLVSPEGQIGSAVYSSGAIGRFTASDIIKRLPSLRTCEHEFERSIS